MYDWFSLIGDTNLAQGGKSHEDDDYRPEDHNYRPEDAH